MSRWAALTIRCHPPGKTALLPGASQKQIIPAEALSRQTRELEIYDNYNVVEHCRDASTLGAKRINVDRSSVPVDGNPTVAANQCVGFVKV